MIQKSLGLKRIDYDQLVDYNHDKYIKTPTFNTLAVDVFNAGLAKANVITKIDFDDKLSSFNKNLKHLIQVVLLAKVILKKMVHQIF